MTLVETKLYSRNSITQQTIHIGYGQFGVFREKVNQEQKGIISARDTIFFGKSLLLQADREGLREHMLAFRVTL